MTSGESYGASTTALDEMTQGVTAQITTDESVTRQVNVTTAEMTTTLMDRFVTTVENTMSSLSI